MLALAPQPEREMTLPHLPLDPDLFGRVLLDCLEGRSTEYYLRRDDNMLERDSTKRYFCSWTQLPAHQRCLLNHAYGRVLDLGAGAGQHTLALQERGLDVVAIDASPLAVEVCRRRGVRQVEVMDALEMRFEPGSFDTALLMSNNLGIAGTPDGLRQLLQALHTLIRPGGQVLMDIAEYTATNNPLHLSYHRRNAAQGRYPGALRLRIEYDGKCGPQFDWLLLKLADLRKACAETGWRLGRCIQVNEAMCAIGLQRVTRE